MKEAKDKKEGKWETEKWVWEEGKRGVEKKEEE